MDQTEQRQINSQSMDEEKFPKELKIDEQKEVSKSSDSLSTQAEASGGQVEADVIISDSKDSDNFGKTKTSIDRVDATMPVDSESSEYNMKHKKRGLAVIFSYSQFVYHGPKPRSCAKDDTEICKKAFEDLKYEVLIYENLKKEQFLEELRKVRESDHSDCDSLVIIFMSHGGLDTKTNLEFLWTYDAKVNTSELWKNFTPENCLSLAGKPKLFFIQACRGEDVDKGVTLKKPKGLQIQTDSGGPSKSKEEDYAIPLNADMLIMWASYPGLPAFKSFQNGMGGSVFLHFLAEVFRAKDTNKNLMSMLFCITRKVAIHYEADISKLEFRKWHQNKQIPQIMSTLMRDINFG